jgi:prophage DNA circulation protein
MSAIADIHNPWRDLLRQQASFRGVIFHVETGARLSGRRTVVHEYPKRNDPYSEDMGRQARRWNFSGYLIYSTSSSRLYDYVQQRYALYSALENDDPGKLVHPVFCKGGVQATCERYTMVETRNRGGFTEFEMQFVEAGSPGNSLQTVNTASQVANQANDTDEAAATAADSIGKSGATPPTTGADQTQPM